jgi:hypothetical protein
MKPVNLDKNTAESNRAASGAVDLEFVCIYASLELSEASWGLSGTPLVCFWQTLELPLALCGTLSGALAPFEPP